MIHSQHYLKNEQNIDKVNTLSFAKDLVVTDPQYLTSLQRSIGYVISSTRQLIGNAKPSSVTVSCLVTLDKMVFTRTLKAFLYWLYWFLDFGIAIKWNGCPLGCHQHPLSVSHS